MTISAAAGDGLTQNANDLALTLPGTLSVASVNASAGNHTHAITSSSSPVAASILASDANGYLQLVRLGMATAPNSQHVIGMDISADTAGELRAFSGVIDKVAGATNYNDRFRVMFMSFTLSATQIGPPIRNMMSSLEIAHVSMEIRLPRLSYS